jgi:hypothetical protein
LEKRQGTVDDLGVKAHELTPPPLAGSPRVELHTPATPPARESIVPATAAEEPIPAKPPASVISLLGNLRQAVKEPLPVDGIEALIEEKYHGFEVSDYLAIYPLVREAWKNGMYQTLRTAIDSGKYISEIVPAGQSVDTSKYAPPGETFHSIASETAHLGNGLVEYKIVVFDRVNFPAQYARTFEEVWVHDRIDEAGSCPFCRPVGK